METNDKKIDLEGYEFFPEQLDRRSSYVYINDPALTRSFEKTRKLQFRMRNRPDEMFIRTDFEGMKVEIFFAGNHQDDIPNIRVNVEDPSTQTKVHRDVLVFKGKICLNDWWNDKTFDHPPESRSAAESVSKEVNAKLERLNLHEILNIVERHLNEQAAKLPKEQINEIREQLGLPAK